MKIKISSSHTATHGMRMNEAVMGNVLEAIWRLAQAGRPRWTLTLAHTHKAFTQAHNKTTERHVPSGNQKSLPLPSTSTIDRSSTNAECVLRGETSLRVYARIPMTGWALCFVFLLVASRSLQAIVQNPHPHARTQTHTEKVWDFVNHTKGRVD